MRIDTSLGMRANLESIDVLIHAACIPLYILPIDVMFGTFLYGLI